MKTVKVDHIPVKRIYAKCHLEVLLIFKSAFKKVAQFWQDDL